jgi:hypothetical protein
MLSPNLVTGLYHHWHKRHRRNSRPPTLEQTVLVRHKVSHSQRAIARELDVDRRKVKRILDQAV